MCSCGNEEVHRARTNRTTTCVYHRTQSPVALGYSLINWNCPKRGLSRFKSSDSLGTSRGVSRSQYSKVQFGEADRTDLELTAEFRGHHGDQDARVKNRLHTCAPMDQLGSDQTCQRQLPNRDLVGHQRCGQSRPRSSSELDQQGLHGQRGAHRSLFQSLLLFRLS